MLGCCGASSFQHAFRLADTYAERIGVRLYACHLRVTVLTNIFMYPVTEIGYSGFFQ